MNATTAPEIAAFNALTQAAFHHEPRSPSVPAEYAYQRWFCEDINKSLGMSIGCTDDADASVTVYRSARADTAELQVTSRAGLSRVNATMDMTPNEMRDLAARLIDAAYDIELWPADRLKSYASLTEQVPA